MTSSYNLSRRIAADPYYLSRKADWNSYHRTWGNCSDAEITVPIIDAKSGRQIGDNKLCVAILNEDGNPLSYPLKRNSILPNCQLHFREKNAPSPYGDAVLKSSMDQYDIRNRNPYCAEVSNYFIKNQKKYDGTGYNS
jgi:hypothetical protein